MTPEVDKLHISKFVNTPNGLDNLKTKVGGLDTDKLKTSYRIEKLGDIVSKKVVKNTKFYSLNSKVNTLEKKIPGISTLIQTNQINKI